MTLFIILGVVIIVLTIQHYFRIIPISSRYLNENDYSSAIATVTIILLIWTAFYIVVILPVRTNHKVEFNNYINYVENYESMNDKDVVKTEKFQKWNNKLEKAKTLNNTIFGVIFPNDELNEALKAREEALKNNKY